MGAPKLTKDQYAEITRRYAAGETSRKLANEFGITKAWVIHVAARGGQPAHQLGRPPMFGKGPAIAARSVRFPADVLQAALEYGELVAANRQVAPGLRYFARRGMEAWRLEQEQKEHASHS